MCCERWCLLQHDFGQRLCAIWNRIRGTHNLHCWYLPVEKIITHADYSEQGIYALFINAAGCFTHWPLELKTHDGGDWGHIKFDCGLMRWTCPSVCLSSKHKTRFSQKTKQSRAMVSTDDLSKNPLLDPLNIDMTSFFLPWAVRVGRHLAWYRTK